MLEIQDIKHEYQIKFNWNSKLNVVGTRYHSLMTAIIYLHSERFKAPVTKRSVLNSFVARLSQLRAL